MFYEFRMGPGAYIQARKHAYIRAIILLLLPAAAYAWMHTAGHLVFYQSSLAFLLFPFVIAIAFGVYSIYRSQQLVKNFRLLVTPEGLQFTRGLSEVRLPFADISRVISRPDHSLIIYSVSAPSVPFLYLTQNIENIQLLTDILKQHAPVIEDNQERRPLIVRQGTRLLLSVVLLVAIFIHFFSEDPYVRIGTGIVAGGFLAYQLIFSLRMRRQLSSPVGLVMSGILLLLILTRIVLAVYALMVK